ncbi:MAG: alcohol dehydrogenase catalytic domain-containing protein [Rhizobiales bacterium]|nr:alcohol dehydrogenase catalytic domain-containing protein [Hyphomicrobiales bacterium]
MKVLNIHEVNDVRLDDYVLPEAGPKDVVLKMKACGICGSDLTYIKYGGIMRQPGGVTPIGHEGAGEVMRVGSEVKDVSVGDSVIVNPMMTPSNIGSGGPEGAFVDQLLVREAEKGTNLLPIPEGVSYEVAAMCEPLAVALHGVNRAEAKAGQKVAVFGCGPIGLGMILWLADRGVEEIIALDLADERLERAKALGAKYIINPGKEDMRAKMAEYHGETKNLIGHPAIDTDAYIDAAGGPNVVADIIEMSKGHCRIVITAAYMQPVALPLGRMLTSEPILTTAVGYPTEMPDVIAAMPRLQDKITSMISHRLPFGQVLEGIKLAGTPDSAKVMIAFEDA